MYSRECFQWNRSCQITLSLQSFSRQNCWSLQGLKLGGSHTEISGSLLWALWASEQIHVMQRLHALILVEVHGWWKCAERDIFPCVNCSDFFLPNFSSGNCGFCGYLPQSPSKYLWLQRDQKFADWTQPD